MALSFFRIREANAEIERLNGEVARLTAELQSAKDNAEAVAASAETLKSESAASIADHAKLKTTLAEKETALNLATDSLATVTAERDELKARVADPSGEIQRLASARAAEITRTQGQPEALPNTPGKPEAKSWAERALSAAQSKAAARNQS